MFERMEFPWQLRHCLEYHYRFWDHLHTSVSDNHLHSYLLILRPLVMLRDEGIPRSVLTRPLAQSPSSVMGRFHHARLRHGDIKASGRWRPKHPAQCVCQYLVRLFDIIRYYSILFDIIRYWWCYDWVDVREHGAVVIQRCEFVGDLSLFSNNSGIQFVFPAPELG